MSNKSNNQGRGYEYVWIKILEEHLQKIMPVKILQNSSLDANKNAFETLTEEHKKIYKISAESAVETIFELEPRIFENLSEELSLKFLKDEFAIKGDVRDIVISRKNFEIGLSIKHNHDAIKHSRLSPNIDFGAEWFENPCSKNYWQTVNPIFDRLKILKAQNLNWSDVEDKNNSVYDLRGTLNNPSEKVISVITVPKISLPNELIAIKFKK